MQTAIFAIVLASTSLVRADAGPRQEISLNGTWQCQVVTGADAADGRDSLAAGPPAAGAWKDCTVPGYLSGEDYQRAWLRRSFTVPAAMRGQRIQIHFGGVKFHSRVYVNGKHVGGCFGGYEPFDVDVTDAVRFDGPNELVVGCHDWTGVFSPGRVEFPKNGNWEAVRNAPRDKILSPIGGLFGLYGIWDDVTLRAHAPVFVKDLFIKPSVRRGELVVEVTVANESPDAAKVDVAAAVEDGGREVLAIPASNIQIPAGGTATVTLRKPWARPPLWSHIDPHLLFLRTSLSTGDQLRTRFGFREFWTEGHKFFLNGTRINLLATSWWPPHGWMTRDEIRKQWETVKRIGCVAFRTHTQPWPSLHYEVADEVGLLMIVEGAVWNDDETYRIYDPVFWQNYGRHLKAMVQRDKNHPSVVMWSLENEFFGSRLNDASPAKKDLVRMGRLVKECDPTRPIYYESDGDPDGVADCVGIHYPHEYPHFTCWPNEALWLQKPVTLSDIFLNGQKGFFWRKDKPIYVGEFLWIPSRDPSWHTVFFGDEAYKDYHLYRNLAKAESWKMQILGYRHLEVGGISPWTVIEGGPMDDTNPLFKAHQYAYQHIAAYPLEYDRRFFAGEEIARRVAVFNDVPERSALRLKWTLTKQEKQPLNAQGQPEIFDAGETHLDLQPGQQHVVDLRLRMPREDQLGTKSSTSWFRYSSQPMAWTVEVWREGQRMFDAVYPCEAYSRCRARPDRPGGPRLVHVYDPKGETRKAIESLGFRVAPMPALNRIGPEVQTLILGANTLEGGPAGVPVIGRVCPERAAIRDFVMRGGRMAVLHQESYPEGLFDIPLTDHRSTMAFSNGLGFDALGPGPDMLKFWRGDHLVATRELARPVGGGFQTCVVSGSAAGIDHAPVLVQPIGPGVIVYSQLLSVEKFAEEPAAAQHLAALLEGLFADRSPVRRTGVLGGSKAYHDALRQLGLQFDDLDGKPLSEDIGEHYNLVICHGDVTPSSNLRFVMAHGGTLYLHRPTPKTLAELRRVVPFPGLDLAMQPYGGPVSRSEALGGKLGVTREDLYWLGHHAGIDWADTPRATNMVDGIFARTFGSEKPVSYEIEDWRLNGGIVERVPPGVTFASAGSATKKITFPETNSYIIGLVARGTPCRGEYPQADIRIDGKPFGTIAVNSSAWQMVTTFGRVSKGEHEVSVAFVNDASDPPKEDRNLYVDKVLIAPDRTPSSVRFLTDPPAIAVLGGEHPGIVIDLVRWDTEGHNTRKAARLASSLLTASGGDFCPRQGTTIQCSTMTPQPGMPFFSSLGGRATLGCNGYVETPVQVAAAGRYAMELVASGTPAAGVYPLVEVALDGKKIGQIQLTGGTWRSYGLDVDLPTGNHALRLTFLNDLNVNGEDRNLMLDKVTFYRE